MMFFERVSLGGNHVFRTIIVVAVATTLSGCAAAGLWRVDSAGSPVQSVKALQAVDLPTALNPSQLEPPSGGRLSECLVDDKGCDSFSYSNSFEWSDLVGLKGQASKDRDGATKERLRLEWALQAFYITDPTLYGTPEDRRNRLQARLISASDTNCAIFAQSLYGVQATGNALLGTTATALGGAGAIVTDVNTARALAGLAGIATGTRAELNQDYFRNLWVEALIKAIETDRDQRRSDMMLKWTDSISTYPVEAAIADAIRYNSACSLVSGLTQVNQAVVIASDPVGLKAFQDVYKRSGFDATFDLSVKSGGKSDRLLSGPGGAKASAAIQEIYSELGAARIAEAKALRDVDRHAPEAGKASAKTAIVAAMTRLAGTDTSHPAGLLKSYVDQLTQLETSYRGLATSLSADTTDADRATGLSQLQTNDSTADVIRRAALDLIHDTASQMDDIAATAIRSDTSSSPPPPAKPKPAALKPAARKPAK